MAYDNKDNAAIQDNPSWTRLILDSIADGVFTVDQQGRITSFNKAAERITGFSKEEAEDTTYDLFKAVGCDRCKTGYSGRFAICESLKVDDEISKMIIEKRNTYEIKKRAIEKGMDTLRDSGIQAIKNGISTLEEIKKVTGL